MIWLFLLGTILLLLIPTAYAGWIGAPYAPTLLPAVKKAFDYIQLGGNDVVIDLGAGDGKIVREAARRGAQAHGIELSPIMWAIAWLRTLGKSRTKITFGNFYNAQLTDATVIFAFLMPANMPRIRRMLRAHNIPHGRYFLAYAFPFKDAAPLHVIKEPNCAPIYIYDLPSLTKG